MTQMEPPSTDRYTAVLQLRFEVNFDNEGRPATDAFKHAQEIGADLQLSIRDACHGSDDRLRYKETEDVRVRVVHKDDGDTFL